MAGRVDGFAGREGCTRSLFTIPSMACNPGFVEAFDDSPSLAMIYS